MEGSDLGEPSRGPASLTRAPEKASPPSKRVAQIPPRAGGRPPTQGDIRRRPGPRSKKRKRGRRRRALKARWGRSFSQLFSNLPLLVGLLLLGFFVVVGVVAPLLYPGDPNSLPTDYNVLYGCQDPSPPTISTSPWVLGPHPFGETAHLGLDVAWSLLLGTRWDLLFLAIIIGVSVLVGSLLGAAAGAVGGWTETVLGPVFDGVLSFPPFLVVLLVPVVAALPGASSWLKTEAFVVAMLAVLWAPFAQGVRAKSRMLVRQPFVEAARAAGARWPRILWRHILPNSMAPVLAQIPATIFSVLFTLGAYQYLGLISNGTPRCGYKTDPAGSFLFLPSYHFPEWTWTMANGVTGYFPPGFGVDDWWAYLIPSAWILLFILAVTLVCDGLVGHLDPYLRH